MWTVIQYNLVKNKGFSVLMSVLIIHYYFNIVKYILSEILSETIRKLLILKWLVVLFLPKLFLKTMSHWYNIILWYWWKLYNIISSLLVSERYYDISLLGKTLYETHSPNEIQRPRNGCLILRSFSWLIIIVITKKKQVPSEVRFICLSKNSKIVAKKKKKNAR